MPERRNEYPVAINYGRELQKVGAEGKYNYLNPKLTSGHFPTTRTGEAAVSMVLVNFGQTMPSSEVVVAELDKKGLRPAEAIEIGFLGAQHPDVQRELGWIVALGSSWVSPGDDRMVADLYGDPYYRNFDLGYWYGEWADYYWFAAVTK